MYKYIEQNCVLILKLKKTCNHNIFFKMLHDVLKKNSAIGSAYVLSYIKTSSLKPISYTRDSH